MFGVGDSVQIVRNAFAQDIGVVIKVPTGQEQGVDNAEYVPTTDYHVRLLDGSVIVFLDEDDLMIWTE